jgi:hypothetical protein
LGRSVFEVIHSGDTGKLISLFMEGIRGQLKNGKIEFGVSMPMVATYGWKMWASLAKW